MRKLILSILMMAALLVTTGGATYAVFSQEATIPGNTISTATVNITLGALDTGETIQPLNVAGLAPGDQTPWGRAEITNAVGGEDVKLYFYVRDVEGMACESTTIELATGPLTDPVDQDGESSVPLYSGSILGIDNASERVEITGAGHVFDPSLPADTTTVIQQRAGIASDAGNAAMNASCTWTEVVVAESATTPAPAI